MRGIIVTPQHLVALIAYVQSRDQKRLHEIENKGLFLADLVKFRRRLVKVGISTVSDAAVRGWLSLDASLPQRPEALHFLRRYLVHICENATVETDEARSAVRDALLRYFSRELGEQPGEWVDLHQESRLRAIAGLYQTIRPYVVDPRRNEPFRYVLEPLCIEPPGTALIANASMYSHHKIHHDFIYKGSISTSTRFCSAFLKRRHEQSIEHHSFRSISAYVDLKQNSEEQYQDRPCWSGILMRGVQGNKGLRGPIAVPIVAIKSPGDDPRQIDKAHFSKLNVNMHRLTARSHILIGEIDHSYAGIFEFCDRIFTGLRGLISFGMILNCVDPQRLADEISPNARTEGNYFDKWKEATEVYFNKYYDKMED